LSGAVVISGFAGMFCAGERAEDRSSQREQNRGNDHVELVRREGQLAQSASMCSRLTSTNGQAALDSWSPAARSRTGTTIRDRMATVPDSRASTAIDVFVAERGGVRRQLGHPDIGRVVRLWFVAGSLSALWA
jgi:hypothetical protein